VVINGGQGGDEEWGGYFGYLPAYMKTLARQARRNPALLAELAKDSLTMLARPATRNALLNAALTGRRGRLHATDALGPWAGPLIRTAMPANGHDQIQNPKSKIQNARSPLARAMYWDMKWYLPALLQVEDRTSMASSLESRAPLLDYRLVEHAARTPGALKLKNLEMKHIFREAVKDLLPLSIYNRADKMGMPTPVSIWFRGELAAWVEGRLHSPTLQKSGLLSPAYLELALAEHRSGRRDRSTDLWKMISLDSWWRTYIEGDPFARVPPRSTTPDILRPAAVNSGAE
jgi:asparagine synthase (glutamine-hydrolysing)